MPGFWTLEEIPLGNLSSLSIKERILHIMILSLAGLGFLDSIYLSWIKLANSEVLCAGFGDCEAVNSSVYSELWGIPIALFGVFAFLVIGIMELLSRHPGFWGETAPFVVFGFSLSGTIFCAYLTYIEIAVLKAICPFCVTAALCMLIILLLSGYNLFRQSPVET